MSKINKSTLIVLGTVIAAGNTNAATLSSISSDPSDAAIAIKNLEEAGYLSVDSETGSVTLKKSVIDVLKANGAAMDLEHVDRRGPSSTGFNTDS